MDPVAHARRMLEYERWANARVNESLRSAARGVESNGAASQVPCLIKALQIWAHVQWARRMWLSRLGVGEAPSMDEGMFPTRSVEEAIAECGEMDEAWGEYLSRVCVEQVEGIARYTSTEGVAYETRVFDILIHVVNHSSYHRGQIARLVAECGGEVASTDFIAFARTRV